MRHALLVISTFIVMFAPDVTQVSTIGGSRLPNITVTHIAVVSCLQCIFSFCVTANRFHFSFLPLHTILVHMS